MVRQAYRLRGVEVALTGAVEEWDAGLVPVGEGRRPPVKLVPLDPHGKVQWDAVAQGPQAAAPGEAIAYDTLVRAAESAGAQPLTVTGPLHQTQDGYRLQVRLIETRLGSRSWTFDRLNALTCGFTSQGDEICALK
jgi:hypothetical protein